MILDEAGFGKHLESLFLRDGSKQAVADGEIYRAHINMDAELRNYCVETYLRQHPQLAQSGVSEDQLRQQMPESMADDITEAIEAFGRPGESLVGFDWATSAPMSSSISLERVNFGRRFTYLCWPADSDIPQPWTAIAAIRPSDSPDVLSAAFRLPNGNLPTHIKNYVPHLIRLAAIRQVLEANVEYDGDDRYDDLLERYGTEEQLDSESARKAAVAAYLEDAYMEGPPSGD